MGNCTGISKNKHKQQKSNIIKASSRQKSVLDDSFSHSVDMSKYSDNEDFESECEQNIEILRIDKKIQIGQFFCNNNENYIIDKEIPNSGIRSAMEERYNFEYLDLPIRHNNLKNTAKPEQSSLIIMWSNQKEKKRNIINKKEKALFVEKNKLKLKQYIEMGLPSILRWEIWMEYLEIKVDYCKNLYENMVKDGYTDKNSQLLQEIRKDLKRSFPQHPFFKNQKEVAEKTLERILLAISLYQSFRYVQSMNYIAGFLLLVSGNELETFWAIIRLFKKYEFEEIYVDGFPKLQELSYEFMRYFSPFDSEGKRIWKTKKPSNLDTTKPNNWKGYKWRVAEVLQKFEQLNIMNELWIHKWILTLMVQGLPLNYCLRCWDYIITEGLEDGLLRTISTVCYYLYDIMYVQPKKQNCKIEYDMYDINEILKCLKGESNIIKYQQIIPSIEEFMDCMHSVKKLNKKKFYKYKNDFFKDNKYLADALDNQYHNDYNYTKSNYKEAHDSNHSSEQNLSSINNDNEHDAMEDFEEQQTNEYEINTNPKLEPHEIKQTKSDKNNFLIQNYQNKYKSEFPPISADKSINRNINMQKSPILKKQLMKIDDDNSQNTSEDKSKEYISYEQSENNKQNNKFIPASNINEVESDSYLINRSDLNSHESFFSTNNIKNTNSEYPQGDENLNKLIPEINKYPIGNKYDLLASDNTSQNSKFNE